MSGSSTPRTIGKDGEVISGPPTVFTIENIDQFDFLEMSRRPPSSGDTAMGSNFPQIGRTLRLSLQK